MHNVGLQKSQRKMFSKVLKKKFPVASTQNNVEISRRFKISTPYKRKKKNRHPVTSYGGPIRRWPTKKRGKISSLIRLRTDDIALNEGQYSTKSANKQEDNIWNFAATSSKHSVGFGTKGMESLSNDFVYRSCTLNSVRFCAYYKCGGWRSSPATMVPA